MLIIIIDYGGPTVDNISLILNQLDINTKTIKPDSEFLEEKYDGIVLSGGPDHIYEDGSRRLPKWIDEINVPIFGICYGLQLIVDHLKGKIGSLPKLERGSSLIKSIKPDILLGEFTEKSCWMNHYDTVIDIPANMEITSITDHGPASVNDGKRWWGVQFHPENITCDEWGREIFKNFVNICKTS
jgi:GMP synthase (glutamine-hydrolysing)